MDAALHIQGTGQVRIEGLEIVPAGPVGNTGILIETSPDATIADNLLRDWENAILFHLSDRAEITRNTVIASPLWLTGEIPESDGIINMNGVDAHITDNHVSGALLGIFASSLNGRASGNVVTGNFIGMILCNVPAGSYEISGALVGSLVSATGWKVHGNEAVDNFMTGYMVIDGASNNQLTNNAASGNGAYDIQLLDQNCIFGFLVPPAFDNTIQVGAQENLVIKDCALNSDIDAPVLDPAVDPCEPMVCE